MAVPGEVVRCHVQVWGVFFDFAHHYTLRPPPTIVSLGGNSKGQGGFVGGGGGRLTVACYFAVLAFGDGE